MTDLLWFMAGAVAGQLALALALWLVRGPGRGRDEDEHVEGV